MRNGKPAEQRQRESKNDVPVNEKPPVEPAWSPHEPQRQEPRLGWEKPSDHRLAKGAQREIPVLGADHEANEKVERDEPHHDQPEPIPRRVGWAGSTNNPAQRPEPVKTI